MPALGAHCARSHLASRFKKNEYGTRWKELEQMFSWHQFALQVQQAEQLMNQGLSEEDVKSQVRSKMLEEFGQDGPDLADAEVVAELPAKRQKLEDDVRRDGVQSLRNAHQNLWTTVSEFQRALSDHMKRHPPAAGTPPRE